MGKGIRERKDFHAKPAEWGRKGKKKNRKRLRTIGKNISVQFLFNQ